MTETPAATPRPLSFFEALIPIVSLIALVTLSFLLFGDAGALGPNQIALVVATMIAVLRRLAPRLLAGRSAGGGDRQRLLRHRRHVHPPRRRLADRHLGDERHARRHGLLRAAAAAPELFLRHSGDDLRRRVAQHRQLVDGGGHHRHRPDGHRANMGLDPAITAGAIISGAYFGDKSSPLSDSANLAAAAAGADLYEHIRASLWTSIPAMPWRWRCSGSLGEPGDFDASHEDRRASSRLSPRWCSSSRSFSSSSWRC